MREHADINTGYLVLEEYIPARNFRTIMAGQRELPHAKSEIAVQIEFAKNSPFYHGVLPAYFEGVAFVHGYVHDNEKLKGIFSGPMVREYEKRHIYLHDWKDKFLVVFENGSKTAERKFFTTIEDVWNLMKNCRHPNV